MSYPRGKMDKRVVVYEPIREATEYGQGKIRYRKSKRIWAWVTWVKGARAMNHGHLDVYQTVMVRCDATAGVKHIDRLGIDDKIYAIDSLNDDKGINECQITAVEIDGLDSL